MPAGEASVLSGAPNAFSVTIRARVARIDRTRAGIKAESESHWKGLLSLISRPHTIESLGCWALG